MRSDKLLDAIGEIGADKITEAKEPIARRGARAWVKCGAMAACVCLIAAGALWYTGRISAKKQSGTQETAVSAQSGVTAPLGESKTEPATQTGAAAQQRTSETYSNLEELLAYLSGHDYHGDRMSEAGGGGSGAQAKKAEYAGFLYELRESDGRVTVSQLDGGETATALGQRVERIFVLGGRLICVSDRGDELEEGGEPAQLVEIYSLEKPGEPVLTQSFEQRGSLAEAYTAGNSLYLLTKDGVCACGWSRLQDTSAYIPSLKRNGEELKWEEGEISILGEPMSVEYIAASEIDTQTGELVSKKAFYANIKRMFYGEDWLAFTVFSETEDTGTRPELYTFSAGGDFRYTGKLSTAGLFGIEKSYPLADGVRPYGTYPAIVSVTKHDGDYRIIGNINERENGKNRGSFLAVTMETSSGDTAYKLLDAEEYPWASFDGVLWEEDRAILSVCTLENVFTSDLKQTERFVFVDFSSGIEFYENDLTAEHVAGVDVMYTYGSPLGYIEAFIPLGDGIYLRYNARPDGFDIYDFSSPAAPRRIYEAQTLLPEGCRFEFENEVYGDGSFGVKVVWPDENGRYVDPGATWRVYRVVPEAAQPFELISEESIAK